VATVGNIKVRLSLDSGQFVAGVQSSTDSLSQLKSAAQSVELGKLSAAMQSLSGQFLEAGQAADKLEDSLRGTFGDMASTVADFAVKLGSTPPFSAEEVAQAAKRMQAFGIYSEEALVRFGDVAVATGQSLSTVAEAASKFEKFANGESIQDLQKQIGASADDLQRFGAILDENGKILMETERQTRAASDALTAYMASFRGSMEAIVDPTAQLHGELAVLRAELGKASVDFREHFSPAILEAVEALRGMPSEMKTVAGLTLDLGGEMLGGALKMTQFAASLKTLGFTLTGLAGGLRAFGALMLGWPGLLVLAGVAVAGYVAELAAWNAEERKLADINKQRLERLGDAKSKVAGKTAAEIVAGGGTSKDVVDYIQALQTQLESASTPAAKEALTRRIDELQKTKAEVAKLESEKKAGGGTELSKAGQSKAKAEQDKADREAAAKAEKARADDVRRALHAIDVKSKAAELTKAKEIAMLRDVLKQHQVNETERMAIENRIAGLKGQIHADEQRKAEEARKKRDAAHAKAVSDGQKMAADAAKDADKAAKATARGTVAAAVAGPTGPTGPTEAQKRMTAQINAAARLSASGGLESIWDLGRLNRMAGNLYATASIREYTAGIKTPPTFTGRPLAGAGGQIPTQLGEIKDTLAQIKITVALEQGGKTQTQEQSVAAMAGGAIGDAITRFNFGAPLGRA